MSEGARAKVIQLRDGPTPAQVRRVREWAAAEMARPICDGSRPLCQDLAHLVDKIDRAALLAGVMQPGVGREKRELIERSGDPLARLFLRLYLDAERVLLRAANDYSATQRLPRQRTRDSRPRRARAKNLDLPL